MKRWTVYLDGFDGLTEREDDEGEYIKFADYEAERSKTKNSISDLVSVLKILSGLGPINLRKIRGTLDEIIKELRG